MSPAQELGDSESEDRKEKEGRSQRADADGDRAVSSEQQGGARRRASTPGPRERKPGAQNVKESEDEPTAKILWRMPWSRVKESEDEKEKDEKKVNDFVVFLMFLVVAYTAYRKLAAFVDSNRDGVVDVSIVVDKDGNGVPDVPSIWDTSATCHANGVTIAGIFFSPIHYSGMLAYYMLYPVIAVKETLCGDLQRVLHVITYVPMMLLKWIGTKLVDLLVLLRLDRVIAGLCVLFPLVLMLIEWENTGKPLLMALSTIALLCKLFVYEYGLDTFSWIIMHFVVCPFQFLGGGTEEAFHSTSYWSAALSGVLWSAALLLVLLISCAPHVLSKIPQHVQFGSLVLLVSSALISTANDAL